MKVGVVLSGTAHAIVLTWGMWNLSAPTPLKVADVEALPIDIVPIEEFTRSIEGAKEADFTEKPAPVPTLRPETRPEAQNTGDADNDLKSDPEPEPQERPVQTAKREPVSAPIPRQAPEIEPKLQPAEKDTPAAATELSPVNEPAVPVTEEPVSPNATVDETGEVFAKLPETVPLPVKRPKAPKPQTAETSERKKKPDPAQTQTAAAESETKSPIDDIAALLSKEKPASSGARRSADQASLGTSKPSRNAKLSVSELDALRSAIERCWSVPAGLADAENMRATVTMQLALDGSIEGLPQIEASGGEPGPRRAFAGSVKRAVNRCAPYSLPKEKYDTWAEVVVNFSAADMF